MLYQEFVLENYFNGSIIPNRRALKKIYNDFQKAKEHYNSNHYKYDVYCYINTEYQANNILDAMGKYGLFIQDQNFLDGDKMIEIFLDDC